MLNFNGELLHEEETILKGTNRGLQYGDALSEELRVVNGVVYFLEDHYLRLMSSMRILRMEIPMQFTMEFMEEEILKTVSSNATKVAKNVKFTIFRNGANSYKPSTNDISYIISSQNLANSFFTIDKQDYEIELFKDFYKGASMLSNLNTTNKVLNVIASVYASENEYQDCLLLNENKMVVESLRGNVFLVQEKTIKTPPLKDGCLNGILRKKLIEMLTKLADYEVLEESISPFELQKADELFIVNSIAGIIPVTKYRKKRFLDNAARDLVGKLNALARLTLPKQI